MVEVLAEMEAEHPAEADGHVAVTAEIVVDLHQIRDGADPGGRDVQYLRTSAENGVRGGAHRVGDQDLLAQADGKAPQAGGDLLPVRGARIDLMRYIPVPDDGSGDQLGEEGDVQKDLRVVLLGRHLSAVYVDHVGQRLEREKRDADRQGYGGDPEREAGQGVQVGHEEPGVFEHRQDAQIDRDGRGEPRLPALFFDQQGENVVEQGAGQHQEDVDGFPVGVEKQACCQQQAVLSFSVPDDGVQDQHRRQKDAQEHERTEYHTSLYRPIRTDWCRRPRSRASRTPGNRAFSSRGPG